MLDAIATGIINANLGLNPMNNGEVLIINIPPLTEERRRELGKRARSEGEGARVGIRNARKDANDFLEAQQLGRGKFGRIRRQSNRSKLNPLAILRWRPGIG